MERSPQHVFNRQLGVDATRIDGEARALCRKAALRLRKAELVSDEVHQICAVFPVMNRERGIEADLAGINAQEPRANPVEGPGPDQSIRYGPGPVATHLSHDPLNPAVHFASGAPRKGHEKNPARISAVHDQMGDAVSQGICFPCPRARNDEQRRTGNRMRLPDAVFDGPSLPGVEFLEIGDGHGLRISGAGRVTGSVSRFVRNPY